ncbi:S53 family peptidase [Actinospica robiniae]|uniref:S53 family peptidase n=1 Tax=Actinospica robiniae TaxID=304901 RepID=UPI000403A790|nr:S8 family serine peptidase [Actinospica robiniae]
MVFLLAAGALVASCTAAPQARVAATGRATAPAASPPSSTPLPRIVPDPEHVRVLSAALKRLANSSSGRPPVKNAIKLSGVVGYDAGKLWTSGIDGSGTTVAVIEGWDDPSLAQVTHAVDNAVGLPDPVIQTIYPTGQGRLPAQCPAAMVALGSYGSCSAWAGEAELDVISVHAIAPYAKILVVVAPPDSEREDDAASQVAPPEMMQALEYVAEHHLADAVSISDGTGELTYSHGTAEVTAQDPGELAAAAAGIPVTVATGDCGVLQALPDSSRQCGDLSRAPETATWDDSPWVTAVGGSVPDVSAAGVRLGPGAVWPNEGAGSSAIYGRPAYQDGVVPGAKRQVPDITMDAMAGTSQAAPLFAGVLALAAQVNGGPVGPINDALYSVLGPHGAGDGVTDIVTGSNSTTERTGLPAHPGFDEATGWGTVDAAALVPALVTAVRAQRGADAPSARAAAALTALEHGVHLASADIAAGTTSQLSASGFLPEHPVDLRIDGHTVATLTADAKGNVAYGLDPAALKLPAGSHTLSLRSMLITEQATFSSR